MPNKIQSVVLPIIEHITVTRDGRQFYQMSLSELERLRFIDDLKLRVYVYSYQDKKWHPRLATIQNAAMITALGRVIVKEATNARCIAQCIHQKVYGRGEKPFAPSKIERRIVLSTTERVGHTSDPIHVFETPIVYQGELYEHSCVLLNLNLFYVDETTSQKTIDMLSQRDYAIYKYAIPCQNILHQICQNPNALLAGLTGTLLK